MTLDAIEIDIGNDIFVARQAYIALSRAQSLKSICIKSISKKSFITKDSVLKFYSFLGCIKSISKKSFITKDSVLKFYSFLGCIKLIDV
jgi:hypothetical protein